MSTTMNVRPARGVSARHSDVVTSVAFSPDGRRLVSGGWDGLVKLWDLNADSLTLKLAKVMRGKWDEVEGVAFSPDGQTIAGLGAGWDGAPFGAVMLWDADSRRGRRLFQVPGKVDAMSYSPDGQTIATACGEARTVTLWNVADGSEQRNLFDHAAPVWAVAYSPDGGSLATACGVIPAMVDPHAEDRRGEVRIWNLANPTTAESTRLIGHDYGAADLAYSPDGRWIASGGFDSLVKLWDVSRRECMVDLHGHAGWVAALDFSPVDQLLATGGHDRTIRIWDLNTGLCRTVLEGHAGNVYSVAFSPDGRILASGSLDGAVRLWRVPEA